MAAGDDPLWDDICETLLSLAKPPSNPRRYAAQSPLRVAHWQRLREMARFRPPGATSMAARALAAFVPGAWLSLQDVQARMRERPWRVAPEIYARLWRRGWVEQIDDPDAQGRPRPGKGPRGPLKLWRLTALGEAVRFAVLEGSADVGAIEQRPLLGVAENPRRPRSSASHRRRRRVARRKSRESRA